MSNSSEIWQLDEHVRFRRLFDEGVVIHQDQAESIVLNDTGVTFLELCDGQHDMGEIIRIMSEAFDVDSETLLEDLRSFIEELAELGIIHRVDETQV